MAVRQSQIFETVYHYDAANNRRSEREPADSLRDESNIIVGWLPSLTFTLNGMACEYLWAALSKE